MKEIRLPSCLLLKKDNVQKALSDTSVLERAFTCYSLTSVQLVEWTK